MADNVGRQRLGKESGAHGSVRRERAAANPYNPRRGKRRRVDRNDEEVQPEPVLQNDDQIQPEMNANAMDAEFVLPAYAQPPPRRRDRRVTRYEAEAETESQYVDEFDAEMNAIEAEEQFVANVPEPRRRKGRMVARSVAQIRHRIESESEPDNDDEMNDEMDRPPSPPRGNVRASRKVPNPARPAPPPDRYPGGPFDTSLLPHFGKHIAAALWKGQHKNRYLTCYNHGKKIIDFKLPGRHQLRWFWDAIDASGLGPLLMTNYGHVGYGLITAFTERWHSETGTFHLPIGEMTITLDDVSCLLHIPIDGKMLNHVTSSIPRPEAIDMCNEYLNFLQIECEDEFVHCKGSHISFKTLERLYYDNLKLALQAEAENDNQVDERVEFYRHCCIRSFLLYLLGATLFTNKSSHYVDVVFLQYLRDISLIRSWNWGASGLAYLFHYLTQSTVPKTSKNAGYNCLLQAWIMAHFKTVAPRLLNTTYSHADPFASMFTTTKCHQRSETYRTVLDLMGVDEVVFCPYEEHRQERPFEDISWYTGWIMCGREMLFPHLPERVLRQYGHVQTIPRDPTISAIPLIDSGRIERGFRDYRVANYVNEEMRGPRVQAPSDTVPGYLTWFCKVSHPKISPPIEGNPPSPPNMEAEIQGDHTLDVVNICRNVRRDVKDTIDSGPSLEDAIAALNKVYTDLSVAVDFRPIATYQSRRISSRGGASSSRGGGSPSRGATQ